HHPDPRSPIRRFLASSCENGVVYGSGDRAKGTAMGYARHIGRVGALAVTLGVGAAMASTPGIAYADTTSDSASTSSATEKSSSATKPPSHCKAFAPNGNAS